MAASRLFFLLFLATVSVFGQDSDTVASDKGVYVKVLGNSGKIMLSRKSNIDWDDNKIVVEFDEIKEKDINGIDVGTAGTPAQKHGFNTFANQKFNFSQVGSGSFRNISAKTFNFTSNIASGARLLVEVYVFSENGSFSLGDENTTVSEGSVKFNIQIDNWKFCGTNSSAVECKQGTILQSGRYLELTISILGKSDSPKRKTTGTKRTTAEEYDLGGGSVVLSNKAKYDGGQWVNMPSGYPQILTKGSKQLFLLRFQNFTKGVVYDPQVDLDPDTPPSDFETNLDNMFVRVSGRSGRIQFGNRANPSLDPNKITVEFSNLTEKLADGTSDIKDSRHQFNYFSQTDFVFTPPIDDVFNSSTRVKKFTFQSTLNNAIFATEVYMFKNDTTITLGNETTLVKKGDMKFTTTITNWTFCGQPGVATCTQNETGEFLDFSIIIKGNGTPRKKSDGEKKRGNSDEYELADNGATAVVSRKVKYNNGSWEDMASGYPKMVTLGGQQIFIIRLKKFTGKVYYDPTVVYLPLSIPDTDDSSDTTDGSRRNVGSILTFALIAVIYCVIL